MQESQRGKRQSEVGPIWSGDGINYEQVQAVQKAAEARRRDLANAALEKRVIIPQILVDGVYVDAPVVGDPRRVFGESPEFGPDGITTQPDKLINTPDTVS